MKTQNQHKIFCQNFSLISVGIVLAVSLATPTVFAASQTWTNAPVSGAWTNILNWNAQAVPGAINGSGNTVNADIASFTNALFNGIGGAGNPIVPDDATIVGDRSRAVSGLIFDGANCGAYVVASPSLAALATATTPATGILYVSHNGAVRMNPPVTNNETILEPMYVLLPSSTAGIFNLVNNSTNPNAALIISSITHGGSTTRATTFILDGTNTANNIVTNLSEGGGNATGGFTKQGPGTWVLAGPNTFPGASPININAGTLIAQDPGVFGVSTVVTVNSNGVLQVNGVTFAQAAIAMKGGTIRMNGSATINGVSVSTALGTIATLATTSAGDVMTIGNAVNQPTGGAASALLHVIGPGTVLLSQSANYVGGWSLDAGKTQLGNAAGLGSGPNLNIGAGATFDVSPITTSGAVYTLTTTALSASGSGIASTAATIKSDSTGIIAAGSKAISLTFMPTSFTGDTAHPSLYISQGTLSLSGNAFTINNASGTPLGAGTYQLILQASGNITSGGGYSVVGVSGSGLVSGAVGSIQVVNGEVDLVVTTYVAKNLVWQGGNPNGTWDLATTANWLNGGSPAAFNNSDVVAFNSTGSANSTVTLSGTLAPGGVTVDTSVNNYTFTGSGAIAGATSLTKINSGTLVLQNVNTYAGGTIVSNGTVQLGVANAIPNSGAGDVSLYNSSILDLNTFSDTINALIGSGTIDTVAGGTPVLTIGNNNDSGTFSGVIQNTTGTLGLTKNGNGTETLTSSNSYAGPTVINGGTLRVNNFNALGAGASTLTVGSGTLDMMSSVLVGTIVDGGGTFANNSSATTNILVVTNTSIFSGLIVDGSGGGGVGVFVSGGTLRLNGINTYSGGTIVASGAGLAIGSGAANAGTGGIILSNNASLSQPNTGSSSSGIGNNISTVAGATASFYSSTTANQFGNQFFGASNSTNIFSGGNMSVGGVGGVMGFSNFLGTVIVTNGEIRWGTGAGPFGGDNTTFNFVGTGGSFTRDATIIHLGALFGDGQITGPSVTPYSTYWIGAKNIDSVFSGTISGSNNIVKSGTGKLTLNTGSSMTTNIVQDGLFLTTNIAFGVNLITYIGSTTISNGVLALAGQSVLTNSPIITLASPLATLDASQIAYLDNTGTNLITNSLFEVVSGQTLNGQGILFGYLQADAGSVLNPGNMTGIITNGTGTGVLTVTNTATLNGTIDLRLNTTNAVISDELAAPNYVVSGATLIVTNVGPIFTGGNVFHLFSSAINTNGFTSITLPTVASPLVLSNNLAVDGTLMIVSPVSQTPTNITATVSTSNGTTILELSWPSDHLGWYLQMQTNGLSTGLSTNWTDIPGSSSINATNIVVDPTKPTVFYRLSLQP